MRMNDPNACVVCGKHVGPAEKRMEGFTGSESPGGGLIRDMVIVAHPECYARLTPEERSDIFHRERGT
jgi:hypothetical protein